METRILPTVTAVVSRSELRLTGDMAPNNILVVKSGDGVQIVGRNGTTIKVGGDESASAIFSGVTSLRTTFKGSNDIVQIGDGLAWKNVTLALGAGMNLVAIGASQISGTLTVTGGVGADTVQLTRTVVGNARLTTNSGDDHVTLGAVSATGTVTLNTGNGADRIETILVTPNGEGDGGGIGGVGGLGGLTQFDELVEFIQSETDRNLGTIVNFAELQEFVDENGRFDLTQIIELAEEGLLDQLLNLDGTLDLSGLLNLGNLLNPPGEWTDSLEQLAEIVNLRNLSEGELIQLQRLIDFASEFDLADLVDYDDLLDDDQPEGLGTSITATLSVNTGSGDDVVSLANARFGLVSILTGNDRDQILLDTVAVDRTVRLNTGRDDDLIRLNGVQQSGPGSNLIDASSGIDRIAVATSFFGSGVTLGGGSTAGNLISIDDVMFKSFATVNAIGMGDTISVEQDPSRSGASVFTQAAAFNLAGAAEMTVSLNQPTTSTRFLSTVKVTGRSPRGRLRVAVDRTELASPVILKNVEYSAV